MAINQWVRRGGRLVVGVAGALVLGATGCGRGGDEAGKPSDTAVAGTRLCGGSAVTAHAAEALRVITGASRFEDEKYTIAHAGQELSGGSGGPGTVDGDVCRIYTPVGRPEVELRITWLRSDGTPAGDPAPKFTVLPMGERALTATDGAVIRFACRSGKLTGSAPAHVDIGVERGGMPTEPEGDPDELKDAYATVAHSFSLAMAKELGCETDGGLEPRPSSDPAPR
ncbi:hypothetical protein ABZ154_04590 [Streptomyces sp. NPDC006261]|uniref:hypothetical protein n=1 Tax=Streptomyces sp. NPDC006261 TaxID=3156739 RepID=UPI0033AEE810